MQIRKAEGLESLLQSLSLDEEPGKIRHVVYPWDEYSGVPGQDVGFWYSTEGCQYSTLRRLILQEFKRVGHPTSDRLADGLVLAFALMPKTHDVLTEFEKILDPFAAADVSQFLFIPASALLEYVEADKPPKHEIIGLFGHGPFQYAPLAGDLMRKIKYRFERIGVGALTTGLDEFHGRIAVYREPRNTKVMDFTGLGFKGHQPPEVVNLMQHYFDDLSDALFEDFWQEHLESQYFGVAAGATVLDRASLESLPGTAWLSIFWGFDLLTARGMISLTKEESHRRNTLGWRVHSLGEELGEAKRRVELELTEALGSGPYRVYASLHNFARLVARSRELESRGYVDESFTLLMIAMESILAERDSISTTLRRRAATLLAVAEDKNFGDSVKSVLKLYEARSRFVHQGETVTPDSLKALQEVCRTVFFAACRSQARFTEGDENWKGRWVTILDYISACFDAGLTIDSGTANISGALKNQRGQSSS